MSGSEDVLAALGKDSGWQKLCNAFANDRGSLIPGLTPALPLVLNVEARASDVIKQLKAANAANRRPGRVWANGVKHVQSNIDMLHALGLPFVVFLVDPSCKFITTTDLAPEGSALQQLQRSDW